MAGTAKNDWGEGRGELAARGGAGGGEDCPRPVPLSAPGSGTVASGTSFLPRLEAAAGIPEAPWAEFARLQQALKAKTVSFPLRSVLISSEKLFFLEFLNRFETRVQPDPHTNPQKLRFVFVNIENCFTRTTMHN